MSKSGAFFPRLAAYLGGNFVPTSEITVEQTAYGNADTATLITPCDGSPDYGAMSQQGKYIPVIIKAGEVGKTLLPNQVLYSYLDEINTDYKADTIDMTTRGILALLIDKKMTIKADQNVDVGDVIRKVITDVGLTAQVGHAGVDVGKVLADDYASMSTVMKRMDYINALANGVGWKTRVVGQTVIVGPPGTTSANLPTTVKSQGKGDLLECKVKHSALHAHNIHVKVTSYLLHNKAKHTTDFNQKYAYLLNGQTLDVPTTQSPSQAKTPSGKQSASISGAQPADTDTEEYVFSWPGLSKDACILKAQQIQEELSRHEFILEVEFSPTQADVAFLAQNGPEFLFKLTGASQGSHNQTYHPRRVSWHWSVEGGLKINILAVNHVLPQNTGGLAND
jgi:hypothetical protein